MSEYSPQAIAQAISNIYGQGKTLASIPNQQRDEYIDMLGVSMNDEDLLEYEQRILNNTALTAKSQKILHNWQHISRSTSVTQEQASSFVNEWLSSFGLSELYNHHMLVGVTNRAQYGSSSSAIRNTESMPCWSMHFILEGKYRFLRGDSMYETQPGDIILIKPGTHYEYWQADDNELNKHIWILFQPRPHWNLWINGENIDKQTLRLPINSEECISHIRALFLELLEISNTSSQYKNEFLYNHLERILIQAQDYQSQGSSCDNRIKKACEYIQHNLARKFSVDDVAKACNLSASWLAHLFKDQMGVSLKHWHSEIRLQEAKKYLSTTKQPISAIAKQLGYEDPALFTKTFKKHLGCNPTDYRQKQKQAIQ